MASRAHSNIKSISYAKYGYMFILPFFVFYALFALYPLIYTFVMSFQNKDASDFVGLTNFRNMLFASSGRSANAVHKFFLLSIGNTLRIWICNFIPQLVLSLLLAVWFTDSVLNVKGKGIFKVLMYMPNILTAASVAALFLALFGNTDFSAFNSIMKSYKGESYQAVQFLDNVNLRFTIISIIQTWMWFGNTMILLISGILGINPSLYEAANIDGANSQQVFFKITVPLLRPILLFTVITSMIGGLQMFDIPLLYNVGESVPKDYHTVAIYIYNYYTGNTKEYGYAGSASVLLFLLTAILGSIVFYMNRDKDAIEAKKRKKKLQKQLSQKNNGFGGF